MEKNVVSFVFKMTTKTQRGHYYMIKIYVMDTNVLIQSPNALFSFEDNLVVLPMVVLEELDHSVCLKNCVRRGIFWRVYPLRMEESAGLKRIL